MYGKISFYAVFTSKTFFFASAIQCATAFVYPRILDGLAFTAHEAAPTGIRESKTASREPPSGTMICAVHAAAMAKPLQSAGACQPY